MSRRNPNGRGKGHRQQTLTVGFQKYAIKGNDVNECWRWCGAKNAKGYGVLSASNVRHLAHRASWLIHHGEIPFNLNVLHSCDNPECSNPKHLFIGTQKDNMEDARNKGRNFDVGEHVRKVSSADELEIVRDWQSGASIRWIGNKFGVSRETIRQSYFRASGGSAAPRKRGRPALRSQVS